MDKLKPCPFCGGYACAEISYSEKVFRIHCAEEESCLAEMTISFASACLGDGSIIDFTEVEKIMECMIRCWNRRADNATD